ncbi:MAG TPA: sigma-70 family RNA polymerase sigma factor [Bryobacteraceae bacterium]|jgi:RNA polymerase sigma factor (sigma-70 family)|nr:sigma-70 family RNA polymerase sigma factor [Bryobacteraceae bacterium]
MGTSSPAVSAEPGYVKLPSGFSDLFQRYGQTVYQAALRVTGNPADAEDVLQSVFLRMIHNQVAPDPLSSPEHYLRRAATNASIDLLRRKNVLPEVEIDEGRDYNTRQEPAILKERVRRALAKLPPEDAELFVLCYLEGYSYDELAEQFQVERGTVASRLHRIRVVLQKHLSR